MSRLNRRKLGRHPPTFSIPPSVSGLCLNSLCALAQELQEVSDAAQSDRQYLARAQVCMLQCLPACLPACPATTAVLCCTVRHAT